MGQQFRDGPDHFIDPQKLDGTRMNTGEKLLALHFYREFQCKSMGAWILYSSI